jgi:hypothetical protein
MALSWFGLLLLAFLAVLGLLGLAAIVVVVTTTTRRRDKKGRGSGREKSGPEMHAAGPNRK